MTKRTAVLCVLFRGLLGMLNVGVGSLSIFYGVLGGWADVGRDEAYLARGYGFAMLACTALTCMLLIVSSSPLGTRRPRRLGVPFWIGLCANVVPMAPLIIWHDGWRYISQLVLITIWLLPLNVLGLVLPRPWLQRLSSCTNCGYDLRGLTTEQPCPECGRSQAINR
jgi:hypothetical protein